MGDERVATIIAGIITVVWVASVSLDAVWKQYDPPSTIHALMMAVVGWAFGSRYKQYVKGKVREDIEQEEKESQSE